MANITIRLTAATDVGRVRTNNEDNFILNKDLSQPDWFLPEKESQPIQLSQDGCLLAVADGMGGLNAGEVASEIAISTVKDLFSSVNLSKISKSDKSIEKYMRKCVTTADEEIKKRVKTNPETSGMGTTLIFTWICDNKAHVLWCGDSRGYIFNPMSGLRRITKDHSYVQQLIDEGKLDPKLAFDHPDSNIITRCLGDFNGKAIPDYCSIELQPGDFIMLCSDGLCGLCRDEEIQQIFRENSGDLEQCKNELISHAMDAGGYDNCTLTLCEIVSIDDKTCEKKAEVKKILSSTLNEYVDKSISNSAEEENSGDDLEKHDTDAIDTNQLDNQDNSVDSIESESEKDEEQMEQSELKKNLTVFPYYTNSKKKKTVSVSKGFIVLFVLLIIVVVALLYMQFFGIKV